MKNGPDSILSVVHETAKGLRDAGIMNEISIYTPYTRILRGVETDPQTREPVGLSGVRLATAPYDNEIDGVIRRMPEARGPLIEIGRDHG